MLHVAECSKFQNVQSGSDTTQNDSVTLNIQQRTTQRTRTTQHTTTGWTKQQHDEQNNNRWQHYLIVNRKALQPNKRNTIWTFTGLVIRAMIPAYILKQLFLEYLNWFTRNSWTTLDYTQENAQNTSSLHRKLRLIFPTPSFQYIRDALVLKRHDINVHLNTVCR